MGKSSKKLLGCFLVAVVLGSIMLCIGLFVGLVLLMVYQDPEVTLVQPASNAVESDSPNQIIKFDCLGTTQLYLNNELLSDEDSRNLCGDGMEVSLADGDNTFIFKGVNTHSDKETDELTLAISFDLKAFEERQHQQELDRKNQEEEAKRQRQEKIDGYARDYCDKRSESYFKDQSYPILKLEGNSLAFNGDDYKYGYKLTLEDCKNNVTKLLEIGKSEEELIKIINWEFWYGMGKGELYASLGSPDDTNTTATSGYRRVQNIYRFEGWNIKTLYIYTENGVVSSYQN